MFSRRYCISLYATVFLVCATLSAGAVERRFAPARVGAVLPEGGWAIDRTIGGIEASPEFAFPLQLVYLTSRSQRGLLGDQWFCPQLESNLIPRGKDLLVWTFPSGGVIGLFAERNRASCFIDQSGQWRAKVTGALTVIRAADGWQYAYRAGRLVAVDSPTGRQLLYRYQNKRLSGIALRDTASNAIRPLLALAYQPNGRLASLDLGGQIHRVGFAAGQDGRLTGWQRPGTTPPDRFGYAKTGLLLTIEPAASPNLNFLSEFAPPLDIKGEAKRAPGDEKDPALYRLVEDDTFKYIYPQAGDGKTMGKVTAEAKASGAMQSLLHSAKRGVDTMQTASGETVTTFYYRAPGKKHDGKLRRIEKDGLVQVENYYDKRSGELIESRDANRISTYYEYASLPKSAPAEQTARFAGKPVAIYRGTRREHELVARMKYDAQGRLTEKIDSLKNTTHLSWNSRGELESMTEPGGTKIELAYDAFGKVLSRTIAGLKDAVEYDEQGRLKTRTAPDGQTIEPVYDALGRVEAIRQNGIEVERNEYDAAGRVTARVDALGRRTGFEYDQRGNLLLEAKPDAKGKPGPVTRYEYDERNLRTAQIDGNGGRVEFEYDQAGHLVTQRHPGGGANPAPTHPATILKWTYDKTGRLTARDNGIQQILYAYDEQNRPLSLEYRDKASPRAQKIVHEYDAQGRLASRQTPTITENLFYDSLNRVIARQHLRGSTDRVLRYTYDSASRKTSITLSEKGSASASLAGSGASPEPSKSYRLLQQTQYQYDPSGRLATIQSNGQKAATFEYGPQGRLTRRTYGNGIRGQYAYDKFGRPTRLELTGGPLIGPLLLAYQWDNAGQVTSRTWNHETQYYTYDPAGQLLKVEGRRTSEEENSPNTASNLRPATNAEGANSSLSTINSQPSTILEEYRYDLAGNIIEKTEDGQNTVMTYNSANELVSATSDPLKNQPSTISFTYDSAARLILQSSSSQPSTLNHQLSARTYGWLDKLLFLDRPEHPRLAYDYYPDGQFAAKGQVGITKVEGTGDQPGAIKSSYDYLKNLVSAKAESAATALPADPAIAGLTVEEEMVWDGLALLYREDHTSGRAEGFAIEPHISGDIPIVATRPGDTGPASQTWFINDILGTTLAMVTPDRVQIVPLTAFGKPRAIQGTAPDAPRAPPTSLSPEQNAPADLTQN